MCFTFHASFFGADVELAAIDDVDDAHDVRIAM